MAGRKVEGVTPRSRIREALRALWLKSRERSHALKQSGYRCSCCNVKQSSAKGKEQRLDVHHVQGIEWEQILDLIQEQILNDRLIVLCPDCHEETHGKGGTNAASREKDVGSAQAAAAGG